MAHRLGVQSALDVVPAMGLGADAISPLEEASAYATLAAGGIYSKPMAIRKVVLANGKVDTDAGWGQPDRRRAISDGVAYEVTQILQDNILEGTGVGAYFGRPAAGKTGTTDNHADAWFSGYVPQLETTVWVGYPQGEIPMEDVHGIAVAGGTFPATIWKLFMESALQSSPARDWRQPLDPVTWRPFTQGQYGSSFSAPPPPYYYTPSSTTTATTTKPAAPAHTPPPPPPPAATPVPVAPPPPPAVPPPPTDPPPPPPE
jgi:penicillin-binding protein 1A